MCIILSLFASELIINKTDGTSISFQLDEIESINFANSIPDEPTEGLVGYYPFNGNADDESGHGNNGVVHGATLVDDRFGNPNSAYSFDGISNYIEVLNSESLNPNSGISFGGWFKIEDIDQYSRSMISKTEYSGYNISLNNGGYEGLISARIWVNGSYLITAFETTLIQPNTWFCVYVTYDGMYEKLYLNGEIRDQKMRAGIITHTYYPLFIGAEPTSNPHALLFLDGIIDDVRIYNRALNTGEIQTLYNEAK